MPVITRTSDKEYGWKDRYGEGKVKHGGIREKPKDPKPKVEVAPHTGKSRLITLLGRLEADEKGVREEVEKLQCQCDIFPNVRSCLRCRILLMLDLMQGIFGEAQ